MNVTKRNLPPVVKHPEGSAIKASLVSPEPYITPPRLKADSPQVTCTIGPYDFFKEGISFIYKGDSSSGTFLWFDTLSSSPGKSMTAFTYLRTLQYD